MKSEVGLKMTRMPATYEPPFGTPLYWADEVTGVLPAAIRAYFAHGTEPEKHPEPTKPQLALVIDYCRYVIYREPSGCCWKGPGVAEMRRLAKQMTTAKELERFIDGCLKIGIDPL